MFAYQFETKMKNARFEEYNNNEEKIYSNRLKVLIKNSDKEERSSLLTISAEMHSTSCSLFRKDLVVRITDDESPLFYYHLKLNDEDYQSLRVQQGLLVDFASFPQKFVDLLEQCRLEETKCSPRFVLHLILQNGNGLAYLNVVEINPFKHLVHLGLKVTPGTDSEVKGYLANCLKTYKAENEELRNHLRATELDLNGRLRECTEQLTRSLSDVDNLRHELRDQANTLNERFNLQISKEKEKTAQFQNEMEVKWERERMELDYNHRKTLGRLEAEVLALGNQVKELTDKRIMLEATVHELRNRVSMSEDEARLVHQELQDLRKENARLEASKGDWERSSAHLNNRAANLEQELRSKESHLLKLQSQLDATQEQKIRVSEELEAKQSLLTRRENSIKSLSDDLNKGNEIIRKLQTDIRNLQSKIKLRDKVTQEQEKVVSDKEKTVETLQVRVSSLEERLSQKETEVKHLNESLTMAQSKVDESQKILKTNENVINWLNKQLNESQVNQQRASSATTNAISPNNIFRPLGNVGQLFATSTPGSGGSGLPSNLLTSRQSPQYDANQAVLQARGKMPAFRTIPEEAGGQGSTTPATANKENSPPSLNAKYLQNKNTGTANTNPSMTTRYKSVSGVRLPRTSIAPVVAKRAFDQTPSAYFPA